MFALFVSSRQIYGDFLINLIAQIYPESKNGLGIYYHSAANTPLRAQNGGIPVSQPSQQLVELSAWLTVMFGMTVTAFLFFVAFMLLFLFALHIPLPVEICDRKKVQVFEFMLRLGNEYLGDAIEIVAGARVRNKLTRILAGIPFIFQSKPPKWCIIRKEEIAGVRCRVYLPQGAKRKSNAAVLYIHGGGWCIMKPRFYDGPLLSLISRIGTPVISIDYRLSPEVQYPSAIHECEHYGIDPKKIAVMGDSAGGNLCSVLCQRALRQKIPLIKVILNLILNSCFQCQVLIYPVINFLDLLSPSYRYYYQAYKGTSLLNPKCLARWCLLYAGIEATHENIKATLKNQHVPKEIRENNEIISLIHHSHLPNSMALKNEELKEQIEKHNSYSSPPKSDLAEKMSKLLVDPDFCPLIGSNLHGLAPCMIVTAGIDILRDEGFFYAKRLRSFDVPVQWNHYDSAFHGIIHMPKSKQRKQILDDVALYLTQNLL